MKDIIKVIWFSTHTLNVYLLPYLWIYSKYFLYFYFFIIFSWKLNDNKCFISELEYKLFGETFMGKKIISKVVICKTADYWEEVLNKNHVPASKIRTLSEALDSQQIKSRAVLQNSLLKNNLNSKKLPTAAFSYSDGSPQITKPAQKIGKSNKDIRKIFS